MKKFGFFIIVFLLCSFCLCWLTACRTVQSSEKAVSCRETASVTESRLTFYRTMDSLARQLTVSVDSFSVFFYGPSDGEFPSVAPSEIEGQTVAPADGHKRDDKVPDRVSNKIADRVSNHVADKVGNRLPNRVVNKIVKGYGLHLTENSKEKAVAYADLKDSVTKVTQSENSKSASKHSSKPSSAPKYIFYILLIACAVFIGWRLRL